MLKSIQKKDLRKKREERRRNPAKVVEKKVARKTEKVKQSQGRAPIDPKDRRELYQKIRRETVHYFQQL